MQTPNARKQLQRILLYRTFAFAGLYTPLPYGKGGIIGSLFPISGGNAAATGINSPIRSKHITPIATRLPDYLMQSLGIEN
jgi:hypothetical protein